MAVLGGAHQRRGAVLVADVDVGARLNLNKTFVYFYSQLFVYFYSPVAAPCSGGRATPPASAQSDRAASRARSRRPARTSYGGLTF